eukprot:TRINITY_DN3415_c0_g2_i2.p2 TRINITY_DN3415_c0_g2~~TRINITY_DN3415_c0_g2_i2.p2  ORF type:complete len:132 (-),score=41.10 TRINITY_DN3415_c0_g2_i2:586-981(-)
MLQHHHIEDLTSLDNFRIANEYFSLFYIPEFLTEEEEIDMLNKINSNKWISLKNRRLQQIGGKIDSAGDISLSHNIPDWLRSFGERLNNIYFGNDMEEEENEEENYKEELNENTDEKNPVFPRFRKSLSDK